MPRRADELGELLEPARRILYSDSVSVGEKRDLLTLVLDHVVLKREPLTAEQVAAMAHRPGQKRVDRLTVAEIIFVAP